MPGEAKDGLQKKKKIIIIFIFILTSKIFLSVNCLLVEKQ
jgi:hypothetical protein